MRFNERRNSNRKKRKFRKNFWALIKFEKNEFFAICLLAKYLENNVILVTVEKTADIQNNVIDAANIQFIINGLAYKTN